MKAYKLNNFVLWCKGWYRPTRKEMPIIDQVKLALAMDGYEFIRTEHDIMCILLSSFDELNDTLEYRYPVRRLYDDYAMYKKIHDCSDFDAFIMSMHNFYYWLTKDQIHLELPTYSNKLYRKGFKSLYHTNGKTYKQLNKM